MIQAGTLSSTRSSVWWAGKAAHCSLDRCWRWCCLSVQLAVWPGPRPTMPTALSCVTHTNWHTLLVLHPFNGWCSSHLQKYCPLKHDVSKDAILPHCPTSQMYKMVFKMAQQFKYSIRPAAVTHSLPVNKRIKQTGYFLSRTCWNAQAHTHKLCSTEGLHLTLRAAAL